MYITIISVAINVVYSHTLWSLVKRFELLFFMF